MGSGARARQLSKQRLLDTLVERALDANAFTRARVMQTWTHLASASAVPLGHYLCVTRLAIGEAPGLEDGSLGGSGVRVCCLEHALPLHHPPGHRCSYLELQALGSCSNGSRAGVFLQACCLPSEGVLCMWYVASSFFNVSFELSGLLNDVLCSIPAVPVILRPHPCADSIHRISSLCVH